MEIILKNPESVIQNSCLTLSVARAASEGFVEKKIVFRFANCNRKFVAKDF
jgi:hypothetical protein